MAGKNDSEIVRLLSGEGGPLWPSRNERRLLKFAFETFGEPLSRFLLSGLGEEGGGGKVWLFTVVFADGRGVERSREVRVEADDLPDSVTTLPSGREPLVMLALLWLLLDRGGSPTGSLFYQQEEVLGLLGWRNDSRSHLTVDEAVNRYVDLSYRWTLGGGELAEKNFSHYRGWSRFISGCGHRDVEEEKGGRVRRVANRVDFAGEFVSELTRRSLFGVDWNRISSLERASLR